jgi:hypothetical protein
MILKFMGKAPPHTFKNEIKISGHPTHEKNAVSSSDDSKAQSKKNSIPAHRMYEQFEITFLN